MTKNEQNNHSEDEKLQAAYALNMCTVSVSQIVDYNDIYILEQEYDAILNNLNLEKMPKDQALLDILTEILNVITFFRIEEMQKARIEKKYQENIRNAIWSAVPNMTAIVAGSPSTMVLSLATEVGIGYMNYRKAKAQASSEKEEEEFELEITALEQFNALRRELFTTAWRLADEYEFPDKYRLTERQIDQYNAILMDPDNIRKFERLEDVADKFEAYPPFWYYLGHTASSISFETKDDGIKRVYEKKAKEYFDKYYHMCKYNLLREDQMMASFALEYVELLLREKDWNKSEDKIKELIKLAVEMSGTANDTLELCAISYIKIGQARDAAGLLRHLVNEDYNKIMNARLLSRIYVSEYLKSPSTEIKANYNILRERIHNDEYLFPMPSTKYIAGESSEDEDKKLEKKYMVMQKAILIAEYKNILDSYRKKYKKLFNEKRPPKAEWTNTLNLDMIKDDDYTREILGVLNEMISGLQSLNPFNKNEVLTPLIEDVRDRIVANTSLYNKVKQQINQSNINMTEMNDFYKAFSFDNLMNGDSEKDNHKGNGPKKDNNDFFEKAKEEAEKAIKSMTQLEALDNMDYDLILFCEQEGLEMPTSEPEDNQMISAPINTNTFDLSILDIDVKEDEKRGKVIKEIKQEIENAMDELVLNNEKARICLKETPDFNTYFNNVNLDGGSAEIIHDAVAIIDDKTNKDKDLLLSRDGLRIIDRCTIQEVCNYSDVKYSVNDTWKKQQLLLISRDNYDEYKYSNPNINIEKLYALTQELSKIH